MEIDVSCRAILEETGIAFESILELDGRLFSRDTFLNAELYEKVRTKIDSLRHVLSSSALTCLHKTADVKQKFPLINLIRQILKSYGFKMVPIRKSNGYSRKGTKRYQRFFEIRMCRDVHDDCLTLRTQSSESLNDSLPTMCEI